MEIKKIKIDEVKQVVNLFCDCFFEDLYYRKSFPNPDTRKKEMSDEFSTTILHCIELNTCFGIYDKDDIVAFVLAFDYNYEKSNHKVEFQKIFGCENSEKNSSYNSFLHTQIDVLSGKTLFLLSLAVSPKYRNMGLASCLLDYMMQEFSEYNFVADVSNGNSLPIYKKRNFTIKNISTDYYLVVHPASTENCTFNCSETVLVAVPDSCCFEHYDISYKLIKEKIAICGCEAINSNGITCFHKKDNHITMACLVEFQYDDFLKYQRLMNISVCSECAKGNFIFFILDECGEANPLYNNTLKKMIECRKSEWSIVPDVFVSIPVQYENIEKLLNAIPKHDEKTNALIKMLDFRTNYELGVCSKDDVVDELANCKRRIKRFYLGKLKIQIFSEMSLECYDSISDPIGSPGYIDLYISIDQGSNCGVLSWYSLSTPFLISHYLDNIIRNQLMVVTENGYLNIFDFINSRYGIVKKGTPKMFIVMPYEKNILNPSQIASLVSAETIYPEGENLGGIIDSEILNIVNSEQGMGQYDRAYVYAHSNVVIQFSPKLRGTLIERLTEESITQFYIELILYQEAAIHIADREIAGLFTTAKIKRPIDFLTQVDLIHDKYSKTIDFWDINVNYPTSQKSINMLRQAFRIQEQREYMIRNQEHLNMVFATKCDIADRSDTKRMDRSLAIISILAIFSAWSDSYFFVETWADVLPGSTIELLQRIMFFVILIIAGYAIALLISKKSINLINKDKKRIIKVKKHKDHFNESHKK